MQGTAPLADKVMSIFMRRLHLDVGDADVDLFESGLLDSLSFVNLLLHLESEFGIVIPLEQLELEQFSSVNRIAAFVAREGAAQGCGDGLLSRAG